MGFANGDSMAMTYNFDSLGKLYISIVTAWTVILLIGATFLISRRNLPYLKIRNIPLALSAVATLHVYWVLCLVAYVLQGHFPCAAEFWIMSIYLPLGIALFQACNTQLLQIVIVQKNYAQNQRLNGRKARARDLIGWRRYFAKLYVDDRVKRAMAYIGYGMIVQVVVTLFVFLVSYKFHEGFGVTAWEFSTAAEHKACPVLIEKYKIGDCSQAKRIACRRGWEWILSIVWQVVWAWCYAPYLLWQLRDVQDVHGWKKQTIFCCVVGLFATPMWLFSLYSPIMDRINLYYVPPLWFAPSIFLIDAFLVFVPCWQILKNRRLQTETLDIIAEWELKNNGSSIGASTVGASSKASWKHSTTSSSTSRRGDMYTMTALDSAIRTNPQRLLVFAATKDFSGENISFLMKVLDWKRGWSPSSPTKIGFLRRPSISEMNNKELRKQQFHGALDIYAACISLKYSEYPINLSHVHLRELETVFECAATAIYGDIDHEIHSATPFDEPWDARAQGDIEGFASKDGISIASTQHAPESRNSTDHILQFIGHGKRQTVDQSYEMMYAGDQLPENVPIPRGFGPEVFDRAEDSIKYMVLTNTWPRFVNAGYTNSTNSMNGGSREHTLLSNIRDIFLLRNIQTT